MMSIMSNDYVKVRKKPVLNCLTCPLCSSLYREATTISVCLHAFCRHCIFQKLEEDERNCCPVCNAYLGSFPEDQLRPDHNLQELVRQIFPSDNTISRESYLDNVTAPVISRLGAPAANEPRDLGMSCCCIESIDENRDVSDSNTHFHNTPYEISIHFSATSKNQHTLHEKQPQASCTVSKHVSDLHSVNKINKGPMQKSFPCNNNAENGRTQTYKTMLSTPSLHMKGKDNMKIKNKEKTQRKDYKSLPGKKNNSMKTGGTGKMLKHNSDSVRRPIYFDEQCDQFLTRKKFYNGASRAVWFCLLPCRERIEDALPEIAKPFIRARNGDVAVSCINKYLVHKLNLKHESEVEVMCCCQPLLPTLTLNNLVDMWAQATSDMGSMYINSIEEIIDSKNYVMELTYRRSKQHRTPQQ